MTQQEYIDLLYKFQCCLANLGLDLDKMESVGEEEKCVNKLSSKINMSIIILRTLKRQVILEDTCETKDTYCLTITQINNLVLKLKENCRDCCMDISFLESCIDE